MVSACIRNAGIRATWDHNGMHESGYEMTFMLQGAAQLSYRAACCSHWGG